MTIYEVRCGPDPPLGGVVPFGVPPFRGGTPYLGPKPPFPKHRPFRGGGPPETPMFSNPPFLPPGIPREGGFGAPEPRFRAPLKRLCFRNIKGRVCRTCENLAKKVRFCRQFFAFFATFLALFGHFLGVRFLPVEAIFLAPDPVFGRARSAHSRFWAQSA